MHLLRQFGRLGWTRWALGLPPLIVTAFLFFNLTGASDGTAHLDKIKVAVTDLDRGIETPIGTISLASVAVAQFEEQAPFDIISSDSAEDLRDDVLGRRAALGFVFPEDFTEKVLGGEQAEVQVLRSEANDAFTNGVAMGLVREWQANLDRVASSVADLGSGGSFIPGLEPSAIVATEEVIAPIPNFRLEKLPMEILFPFWGSTIVMAAFILLAGREVASRFRQSEPWAISTVQIGLALSGTALLSLVMVLGIAFFAWEWSLKYIPLWSFMWLTAASSTLVLLGFMRCVGLVIGLIVSTPFLLIQQIVGGGVVPGSWAPPVYRWLESLVPMRYFTEGFRNILFGDTTTGSMVIALGSIALIGLGMLVLGTIRDAMTAQDQEPAGQTRELAGG